MSKNPYDLGSQICFRILPKKRTLSLLGMVTRKIRTEFKENAFKGQPCIKKTYVIETVLRGNYINF